MSTVTITLRRDDAAPILREAANDAAHYGAMLDYVTRRTVDVSGRTYAGQIHWYTGKRTVDNFDELRKEWRDKWLRAKRIVEAFGVEPSGVSEEEAIGIQYGWLKTGAKHPRENRKVRAGEGVQNYDEQWPKLRGSIFHEACRQAAERTVRAWKNGS